MTNKNILILNDDCLRYILQFLVTEDQINFAQTCNRFREIYIDFQGIKCHEFAIDVNFNQEDFKRLSICRKNVQTLVINLTYLFRDINYDDIIELEKVTGRFRFLCSTLQDMHNLQRLTLGFLKQFVPPQLDAIGDIVNAIYRTNNLKALKLYMSYDDKKVIKKLGQLSSLEELYLWGNAQNVNSLVHLCKSFQHLRILHIEYGLIPRNLKAIIPYCKNLEEIQFGIISKPSSYTQFGKLPKLKKLTHIGIRPMNSFVKLLKTLADRKQLIKLSIGAVNLTTAEVKQLIRIGSLQELDCYFGTSDDVASLGELKNLKKLHISMGSSMDITEAVLNVIRECQKLHVLHIQWGQFQRDFIPRAAQVMLKFRSKSILELTKSSEKYLLPNEEEIIMKL